LAGRVEQHVAQRVARHTRRVLRAPRLDQREHLLEARRKEVQRREDAAVGPELVLLHDLAVVDGVAHVDVRAERRLEHRRVEVHQVVRRLGLMQVGVQPLHERRLAGARHADNDARGRLARGGVRRAG